MSGLFKKALSVFVEFEEETNAPANAASVKFPVNTSPKTEGSKTNLNNDEIEKFENHFDKLMNDANLPGPDYFEFCKMMEALEAHVTDEKARYSAVFASLSTQGLTKEKLINSAAKYKMIIQEDNTKFEAAVNERLKAEVETRKNQLNELETKISQNSELIRKLTQEITEAQVKIKNLNAEVVEKENKIKSNLEGYSIACNAMINKINIDVNKIDTII